MLTLDRSIMSEPRCTYFIDIVGSCNLRCPSCPVGNYKASDFYRERRPKGIMSLGMFRLILDKIDRERREECEKVVISLYNWGEPLLHPELVEFIDAVRSKGFISDLSSNLNIKDVSKVVEAAPNKLIVSLSGYYDDIYSRTHVRGNISLVISNLFKLRYWMDKLNKDIDVEVSYHIYEHNVERDFLRMKEITDDLGFHFSSDIAIFMPVEKNIRYLGGGGLSLGDQDLVSLMMVKPNDIVQYIDKYGQYPCLLQQMTTINFDGSTALCCGVYDYENNIADQFLDVSHNDLELKKKSHHLCGECMKKGVHVMASYLPREEWDQMIEERLVELGCSVKRDVSHRRSIH
jgi:hypothetical protein